MWKLVLQSVALLVAALGFQISVLPGTGRLDPTFGSGGIYVDTEYFWVPEAAMVQPSEKIVLAVDAGWGSCYMARLNENGTADLSFGVDGRIDLGESGCPGYAMLPGGELIIANGSNIERYSKDGQYEGTFIVYFSSGNLHLTAQPDGMVLVNPLSSTMHRYTAAGEPDPTFGTNGQVVFPGEGFGQEVTISSDDGYLIRTYPGNLVHHLLKFSKTGVRDLDFGTDGYVTLMGGEQIAATYDGFLAFSIPYQSPRMTAVVRKFYEDGQLNTSFGADGVLTIPTRVYSSSLQVGKILGVKADGKFVISVTNDLGYQVMKFNPDGTPDTYFGINGTVTVPAADAYPDLLTLEKNRILNIGFEGDQVRFARLIDTNHEVLRSDFDGDGKTDVSIFRPNPSSILENAAPEGSYSQWWIYNSGSQSALGITFGQDNDSLVPADFTGDGKADVAFYRPSTSTWYVLRSEDFTFYAFPFGGAGDIPTPGDFDGDGTADPAVYRPSSGRWFILRSSDGGVSAVLFGIAEDKPVVADYDGDGMDDVAVYRPSVNQWWQLRSTSGVLGIQFGAAGDRTATGDWTGDGKADVAFYRPSTSEFYVIRSEDMSFFAFPWGSAGDIQAPGDYDGDGVMDAAVYRPSIGTWFINGSTSGFLSVPFGLDGDTPIPSVNSQQ